MCDLASLAELSGINVSSNFGVRVLGRDLVFEIIAGSIFWVVLIEEFYYVASSILLRITARRFKEFTLPGEAIRPTVPIL